MQFLAVLGEVQDGPTLIGVGELARLTADAPRLAALGLRGKLSGDGPVASQRAKVRRINRAATAQVNRIFRKYGIRRRAQPEMSKLMQASGELQSAARAERNALAKVFTPTQLQQYDRIMRDVENRIVRAAK